MCGIAALYNISELISNPSDAERVVHDMMDTLVHRGPDAEGLWVDERRRCILGHRRLSIIDTSDAGRQPMSGANGRWVIAFNGEIYNFLEVRQELEEKGIQFYGRTDTEVLIEAIALWGIDALAKLDGMFAFAAFDTLSGELIVARDAFGEKPLYYMELQGGAYVFASELQALEKIPGFDAEVSLDAMAEVLMFQYIGAPRTIYQSIKKLLPGHWMRLAPGQAAVTGRFFQFRPGEADFDRRPLASLADELEDILLRSIKRRLISDVPLGAFLSGGVDSSTVCSLISKKMGLPLKTFSIGFRGAPESEHRAARAFAREIGSTHHDQVLEPDTTAFLLDIGRLLDEPNADSSCMPTFLLSQFARQQVTVAVSGDGGDEMFLGYGRYFTTLEDERTWKHSRGWNPGKAYYSGRILVSNEPEIVELFGFVPEGLSEHLNRLRDELRNESVPLFCRLRKTDVENYLPGAILPKVDRMSMQHSLEVRTPYLNVDLARFAEKLPLETLYRDGLGKLLLREVAYRYLSPKLVNAPKKGFGIPVSSWARGALLKAASELLEGDESRLRKALGSQAIGRFLSRQRSTGGHVTYQVWSLVMLESWMRHHPCILDQVSQKIGEISVSNRKVSISVERKIIARRIDSETFRLDEEEPENWLAKSTTEDAETRSQIDYIELPSWKEWDSSGVGRLSSFTDAKLLIVDPDLARKLDAPSLRKFSSLGVKEIECPVPYSRDHIFMRIRIRQQTRLRRLNAFLHLRLKAIATLSLKRRLISIMKAVTRTLPRGHMLVFGHLQRNLSNHVGEMAHSYLLFEGASQLPPIHFAHSDISEHGKGRYSVWDGGVFFSATRFRRLLTHSYWLVEHTPEIEPYLEYVTTLVFPSSVDRLAKVLEELNFNDNVSLNKTGPIVVFTHGLPPGGAERQWCYLSIGLKERGKDVVFVSQNDLIGDNAHYYPLLISQGVKVLELPKQPSSPSYNINFLSSNISDVLIRHEHPFIEHELLRLISLFRSLKPRAVIAQLDYPNLLAATAALISDVPRIVLSFRNYNPTNFSYLYNDWFQRYYKAVAKSPRVVLTGNAHDANANYAQWIGIPSERIHWIPNAIDPNSIGVPSPETLETLSRTLGLGYGRPVILGVFRLSEEKRPLVFLEVCSRVAKEIPDVAVLVAGVGPLQQKMQDHISLLGLEKIVTLLGRRDDISGLMACASVLLLTSAFEGMPNVVMEAQLLGLPVVATRVGGTSDCVEDGRTGLLRPPEDIEGLAADCITLLRSAELRKTMSDAATARMISKFSIDAMVSSYLRVLESHDKGMANPSEETDLSMRELEH